MKNFSEIASLVLSALTYTPDEITKQQSKKYLDEEKNKLSTENKEILQQKYWDFVTKEALAIIDMAGAVPTSFVPFLKVIPVIATGVNWTLLTTSLIPTAQSEISELGAIKPATAISIIGAVVGLIPTGNLLVAFLKLTASVIGILPDSLPAQWAADALNFSPDATNYMFKVISDGDILAKYTDDAKRATYVKLLEELNLTELVILAKAGDVSAQLLLTYGRNTVEGITEATVRPDEYWGERAQFLALKLKGNITGTYDGFPKYGQAGIYEGFIGSEEFSGYVGVVTPGIGDTIQFGVQGYTAGSLIADDKYWGTSGDDRYSGLGGSDTLYGFEGNDTLLGDIGDDKIFGGTGNDTLLGGMGSDTLKGEADNDVLNGGLGTDYLYGGSGDDWLGYDEADINKGSSIERDSDGNYYEGGTGSDHIFGSVNADRIRFSQGDGTDIVTGNGGADILEYVANGGFLATSREGKNLVLSRTHINGAVDRIVMQNWYADIPAESMRLDRVDFGAIDPTTGLFVASGSLSGDILHEQGLHKQIGATAQELRGDLVAYQETLQGSDRADWLYSSQAVDENSVGDILVGGIGDDYLYGSIGADKIRIGAGDGKDVFRGNGGADIVETYGGISLTHTYTKLDKVGADLRATFIDGTQLTIRDWDVEGKLMAFREGRDGSLVGYGWVNQNLDNFYGDAGVNGITGTTSANELYGYGGADRLVGGGGNDKFWGGIGNDELVGGTGNDTFYYGLGDGIDHVWGGGGSDVLDFQASGQGRPLTASRVGNDIKFSYSASDNVTIHDWFSTAGAAMTVKLPNGQVMSSSQVNAGFNTTALGWTGGVYNSQDFLAVLYSLNSNFKILDDQYKATWGKSFYAQAFNSMVKNYYNDTGVDINGSSVYSWGAGIGNAYATPGTILYGDVWWDFWSNGNGGHNFVITQATAGHVTSGWSYDAGNPGGLNAFPEVVKVSDFYYSNPMQAMPLTRDSFVVYDGSYAQASSMGVYNISSTSESGESAELVGVSNAQMMYLA